MRKIMIALSLSAFAMLPFTGCVGNPPSEDTSPINTTTDLELDIETPDSNTTTN